MVDRLRPLRLLAVATVVGLTGLAAAVVAPPAPVAACPGSGPTGGSSSSGFSGSQAACTPVPTPSPVPPGVPVYYEWGLDFQAQDGVAFVIPLSVIPGLPDIPLPNGCFQITATSGPLTEPPAQNSYAEAAAQLAGTEDNEFWNPCPGEVFDIAAYVTTFWETQVMPPPPSPLQVAPGRALTGLTAYLEIGGEVPVTWTLPNPIGPDITISATPRYVVDWGDGTPTTPADAQGVPYPGGPGEITHTYTDVGQVTVTVEAYWTGVWSAGGDGGDLGELVTPTEATLDLPIEQRQAVID